MIGECDTFPPETLAAGQRVHAGQLTLWKRFNRDTAGWLPKPRILHLSTGSFCRQLSEVEARYDSSARRVLCRGRGVTRVPTAKESGVTRPPTATSIRGRHVVRYRAFAQRRQNLVTDFFRYRLVVHVLGLPAKNMWPQTIR